TSKQSANRAELAPDAILAVGGRVIPILMQATVTVPIVVLGPDPVERGWIKSLARPGGNVTGFANLELSLIGKMLQTHKERAPSITGVAMLYNPDNVGATSFVRSFEAAAPPLGVEAIVSPIHGLADIGRVVVAVAAQPNGGIFAAPDVTIGSLMEQTVALITKNQLPAIYSERFAIAHRGLAFYGVDRIGLYRAAASYVDRILRGEKAGDEWAGTSGGRPPSPAQARDQTPRPAIVLPCRPPAAPCRASGLVLWHFCTSQERG